MIHQRVQGLVSVIMPTFNSEKYLPVAIESVQNQTYKNLELVIVDDGSTDGTWRILNSVSSTDTRIVVRQIEHSGKPAVPRNTAISMSKGQYLTFLDSDDIMSPQKIELQLLHIQNESYNAPICYHDLYILEDHQPKSSRLYLSEIGYLDKAAQVLEKVSDISFVSNDLFYVFSSLYITGLTTQGVFIDLNGVSIEDVFFDENLITAQDIDLWFRLINKYRAVYLDLPLAYYRIHSGGITSNNIRSLVGRTTVHKKNYDLGRNSFNIIDGIRYRRRIAKDLGRLAVAYRRNGNYSNGLSASVRGMLLFPSVILVKELLKSILRHKGGGR